ncbi:MAG: hypothetical protein ABI914_08660, partial [Acidobacteriota bacterium]
MKHSTDQDLLTFHWDADRATGAHVAACASCAARLSELRAVLRAAEGAAVPERGDGYGRDVWARLAPSLPDAAPRPRLWDFGFRTFAAAPAVAAPALVLVLVLVAVGFLAGRLATPRPPAAAAAAAELAELAELRQRVLFAELSEHLARSEAVLLELANAPQGAVDVSAEQARLTELLPANRLYRQASRRAGQ